MKNLKNKIIFNVIIFSGILGTLFFVLIFPTLKDIKNIKEKIVLINKTVDQKNKDRFLEQKINQSDEIRKKIETIFLTENNKFNFFHALEENATANNLKIITNINKEENLKGTDFKKVILEVELIGSSTDELNYLNFLERNDIQINFRKIDWYSDNTKLFGNPETKLNLLLEVYFK